MKEIVIYSVVALMLYGIVLILRPITVSRENSVSVNGYVTGIYDGGSTFDMMVVLKNDPNFYYVNRGFEHRFKLVEAKQQLESKSVTVYYAKHWTPLDPSGHMRHITALVLNGDTLYKEF